MAFCMFCQKIQISLYHYIMLDDFNEENNKIILLYEEVECIGPNLIEYYEILWYLLICSTNIHFVKSL